MTDPTARFTSTITKVEILECSEEHRVLFGVPCRVTLEDGRSTVIDLASTDPTPEVGARFKLFR